MVEAVEFVVTLVRGVAEASYPVTVNSIAPPTQDRQIGTHQVLQHHTCCQQYAQELDPGMDLNNDKTYCDWRMPIRATFG